MTRTIDLNADLGEGCGDDEGLMEVISSANIACGGHAGDEMSMRTALQLAKRHGVAAGAHPSYPDKEHFGRRSMTVEPEALLETLSMQIANLAGFAAEEFVTLRHVKPHGALYNDAARDPALAAVVLAAIRKVLPDAALVGLANSALEQAAHAAGHPFIAEGFADRVYTEEGFLLPRSEEGAVIEAESCRIAQALALAKGRPVATAKGDDITIPVETICVHGDTPGALNSAKAIRAALEHDGLAVRVATP
ncbi:5-oxoprolinase subunit PxpA [Parvularcula marina]|uniref:5-oxoprolinase subunit PxpA n=1 Tax=Parvularcula marina TaxID=2292771 RepID=A0A371RJ64_9PROT|nr:5-oxoprolinase subunit PxpA [Parvularcula marina]RFB05484.1 5-oxoprolinase subunit PxpA [Parvularcula marina]